MTKQIIDDRTIEACRRGDSDAFRLSFAPEQEQLRNRIAQARKHFANVKVERALLNGIAQLCSDLKVDGHRGELTIMRAARALAAFELRKKVTDKDVKTVAVMSLRHRLRRDALELAEHNIRVNAVCPGPIEGDRIEEIIVQQAAIEGKSAAQIRGEWEDASPMKRFVTPEEVTAALMFLASDAASAMTGQALNVTGGFLMT